jgi:hypothetical protein
LCTTSVGLILQATLGGVASDFDVFQLGPRVFRFSVSSHLVGFHVFKLRSFEFSAYKVFFHLWGNGGPRWKLELAAFNREELASWTTVGRSVDDNHKPSFAEVVKRTPLSGANTIPLRRSVFERVIFPKQSMKHPASVTSLHHQSAFRVTQQKKQLFFNKSLSNQFASRRVHQSQPSSGAVLQPSFLGQHAFQSDKGESPTHHDLSNLNLGLNLGHHAAWPSSSQQRPKQYLAKGIVSKICARCLSDKHARRDCKNLIKCFNCGSWGHIADICRGPQRINNATTLAPNPLCSYGILEQPTQLFKDTGVPLGLVASSPPIFSSLTNWLMKQRAIDFPPEPLHVPWKVPKEAMRTGPPPSSGHILVSAEEVNLALNLAAPSAPMNNIIPSASPFRTPPGLGLSENPTPPSSTPPPMAFQRANPTPLVPDGMDWLEIPNIVLMVRAVVHSRPQPRNENVTIATIAPLPGNPLNFNVIREVLREFFDDRNAAIRSIQPTHLGQAYVGFYSALDRETFVLQSPHPFDDVQLLFVRHNQGRNWCRVYFNREVTLLLLGVHIDYWHDEYMADIIKPFGKMINWMGDDRYLGRVFIRARVTDLESIPQFIPFTDNEAYEGDS